MSRPALLRFVAAAFALVVVAGFGYSFAHLSRTSTRPSKTQVNRAVPHADMPGRADTQASVHAKPAFIGLPANHDALDGKDFVAALAELEHLARAGDAKTMRFVFDRLQDCSSYVVEDDDSIRASVDESFRQQRDVDQRILQHHPELSTDPHFDVTEAAHRKALQQAFDLRDRCTALSKQQMESRFELTRLMLERHDRRAIIDFSRFFNISGADLVRNADRLIELRDLEQSDLNSLVESGDLDAMWAAAAGYARGGGLLPDDPEQAYAYAYAWQQANPSGDTSMADGFMAHLEKAGLSPRQVEQARARGATIYQHCCVQR